MMAAVQLKQVGLNLGQFTSDDRSSIETGWFKSSSPLIKAIQLKQDGLNLGQFIEAGQPFDESFLSLLKLKKSLLTRSQLFLGQSQLLLQLLHFLFLLIR